MWMAKILLIEDDLDLADSLITGMRAEKHLVEHSSLGQDGLDRLLLGSYDLAIIDWNLPDLDGVGICHSFREAGGTMPILILTGNTDTIQKTTGLDSGADDYLTKPCQIAELLARIRALLRRQKDFVGTSIKLGNVELDSQKRTVTCNGSEISLQPKEFAVLEFLLRKPEQPFKPEILQQRLWSTDSESALEVVYTCITKLRKKLKSASATCDIKSVYGTGYKISLQEQSDTN
jgi:two-component system, OmpR family, manganese sensing response regulator